MTQTTPTRTRPEIDDMVPGLKLQAGDNHATLEALRDLLLEELDTQTAYEELVAGNLVALELDVNRLRRMVDRLVVEAMFAVAHDKLTARLGLDYDSSGAPVSPEGGDVFAQIDAVTDRIAVMKRRVWQAEPDIVAMIETVLLEEGLDPVLIQALARSRNAVIIDPYEMRLVASEQRRRRLMEDYRRLQAARPEEVEDEEDFDDYDFGV
ncbi:hypothetical protein [Maritimibacter sp. HL-12]|uniref:hypothetical protein n=1 Tax=Maritimibacter sp. HL-12 TaxID=1162418 RepID=UPI000A0F3BF5|nr:hypothetical protein [Maritimibacter sp. HL-12]SMH56248.1 hypothetical protein SAMN05661107_3225 [Maritimibacter sp. HL-12]